MMEGEGLGKGPDAGSGTRSEPEWCLVDTAYGAAEQKDHSLWVEGEE